MSEEPAGPDRARSARVREVFDRCVSLAALDRDALLARECAGEPELRARVEALLDATRDTAELIDAPIARAAAAARETGSRPEAPRAISRYRIDRQLGRGGMGVVWRAVREDDGAVVALKTVAAPTDAVAASVRREIQALSALAHPGIVRILDAGIHERTPWYAMELVEGPTLRAAMASMSRIDRLTVVRRLCDVLAYVHGEGLVHRDVKPENVLLRPDGTPVLVDFGLLATFMGSVSRESLESWCAMAGTVAYASPEQAQGDFSDARSDIYSLGCVLYELLTGRLPFEGQTAWEILGKRLVTDPEPPSTRGSDISPRLDGLVMRMLARLPRARIGQADEVAAALADAGASGWPFPIPPSRGCLHRPGLAGRGDALDAVCRHLPRRDAPGALLLVSGESGIGKTRLAMSVAQAAVAQELLVLAGNCQGSQGEPLAGFRQLIATFADGCGRTRETEATRRIAMALAPYSATLADIAGGVPLQGAATPSGSSSDVERVCAAVAAAVQRVSEGRGVLLILDDLQGADELTLAFLAYLRRAGRPRRTLVLGLHRSEEAEGLEALGESPRTTRLQLGRIDERSVESIAGEMLAIEKPAPALVAFLARHTEGNPFFLAEYLRAAVVRGLIVRGPGGVWLPRDDAAGFDALPVPRSILDVVASRLEALPEDALYLARSAAMFAREAPQGIWIALARARPDRAVAGGVAEALAPLATLQRRQIVEESAPGTLRFSHDKIRQALQESVPVVELSRRHREIATVLEEDGSTSYLAALGHHWRGAGERARAVPCYLRAARLSITRAQREDAERWYRAALELMEPSSETTRARAELGTLLLKVGRRSDAEVELASARSDARARGDVTLELECTGRLARSVAGRGLVPEALALLEEGIALAGSIGDRQGGAALLAAKGAIEHASSRGTAAAASCRHALELHAASGSPASAASASALATLAHVAQESGETGEAISLGERALADYRAIGHRPAEALMLASIANALADLGETVRPAEIYREAIRIQQELGSVEDEAATLTNLVGLYLEIGDDETAMASADAAVALLRGAEHPRSLVLALHEQAACCSPLGRDPLPGFTEALALARSVGVGRECEAAITSSLAVTKAEAGDMDGALADLASSVAALEDSPMFLGTTLLALAETHGVLGDLPGAREHCERARRLLDASGKVILRAHGALTAAAIAIAEGSDARDLLREVRALTPELAALPHSRIGRELRRLEAGPDPKAAIRIR